MSTVKPCPRSWPHGPHVWRDGVIRPAADVVSFSCPGVPVEGR